MKQQLIELTAEEPEILTNETKQRLRSFVEDPRPELYFNPGLLIAYAINHPDENTDIKKLIDTRAENKIMYGNAIRTYFLKPTTSLKLLHALFEDVHNLSIDYLKRHIYVSYLNRTDATPEHITRILETTDSFKTEYGAPVYTAYLRRTDATPEYITRILEKTQKFKAKSDKTDVYTAYMNRVAADAAVMIELLEEARTWSPYAKSDIYAAYISREDADKAIIDLYKMKNFI